MEDKKPRSIKSLLGSYDPSTVKRVKKIKFEGIENHDIYNITAPFKIKRTEYLLGRVELREEELGSKSVFFKKIKKSRSKWEKDEHAPVFGLQDPFINKVKDAFMIGGVEVKEKSQGKVRYRTIFYRGKSLDTLRRFIAGPWGMKGVRFIELNDGKIGVFTRPQGKRGQRGKIGFELFENLKDIKTRKLSRAPILKNQFARGEWGGVNEVHLLKNNQIGVIGHIARFQKEKKTGFRKRYYYPISFLFDPLEFRFTKMKILATRNDLPDNGVAKREDLYNVIYPGGLVRKNGQAKLFVGASDAEAYELTITDPFKEYEECDDACFPREEKDKS